MKSPDGSVYGPVPRAELETWLAEGRISSQCLLKPEGQSHWQAALSEFPQLAALRPRVTSPPPPLRPRVHRDPAVQIPRLTPAYENNGAAIMILGVIGLFLPCLPVFSLVALIWGYRERKAMAAGRVGQRHRWLTDIGFVAGLVGCVISFLVISSCLSDL